jgi:uncharacterized protein (TIGR03437 family)
MKGTGQYPSQPKIFVWTEKGGVQLYEQKPPTPSPVGEGWESATAYNLIAPSVSSDGRTIAITGLADCSFGTPCATDLKRYQAEIRVAGGAPIVMDGVPSVSPNGRFVALGSPILAPVGGPELTVLDLTTGQQKEVGTGLGFARRHGVANDGTALPAAEQLWVAAPQVDASDARQFYEAPDNTSPGTLVDLTALDVATGIITQLTTVETTAGAPVPFDISDDGSLVAFVELGRMWTVHSDGSGLMQIPNVQDPVVEVALSGSGSHIFAITSNSRMLRINLSTLAVEEIIPATPIAMGLYFNLSFGGSLSSGSLAQVDSSTQPIPEIQSVSLFGHQLPILSETTSQMELEIPYDLPGGSGFPDAVLKQQSDGPFESAMLWGPVEVSSFAPNWFLANNYVAALHEDFSGPITPANPAHPGEIIHAYGNGFGPVAPEPPLGQPASANPLSRTTTPIVCGLGDSSSFVSGEMTFSGLAPGWIGLYQFDILLPARPAGADVYLICGNAKNPLVGNQAGGLLPMGAK